MGSALYWRDKEAFQKLKFLFREEIEYCVNKIVFSGADLVGFSILSTSQDRITAEIIVRIKEQKPNLKIIIGGSSTSVVEQRSFLEGYLSPGLINIFVIGEGEVSLCKILQAHRNKSDVRNIKDVSISEKNGVYYLASPLKQDLGKFPFPVFEEFDLNSYTNLGKGLLMEWGRGCIGNCSFCAFRPISGKFIKRGEDIILKSLLYYKDTYNINHISLVDSAINCDLAYLEKICDLIIKNSLHIDFSALAIPKKDLNAKLLKQMRNAGFRRIEYGIESGSDRVLRAMRKIFSVYDAEKAIRLTHDSGIMTVIYLIVGFPGEGKREFNETLEFIKRNAPFIDLVKSVNPLYLMAGSHIFKKYKDYNIHLPEENPDFKWWIDKDNNYDTRLMKVQNIRNLLKERNVKMFTEDNQFERIPDLASMNKVITPQVNDIEHAE
jgi:anaerobic magnesium-protoporphyrin IX monomethyl ester cyclase